MRRQTHSTKTVQHPGSGSPALVCIIGIAAGTLSLASMPLKSCKRTSQQVTAICGVLGALANATRSYSLAGQASYGPRDMHVLSNSPKPLSCKGQPRIGLASDSTSKNVTTKWTGPGSKQHAIPYGMTSAWHMRHSPFFSSFFSLTSTTFLCSSANSRGGTGQGRERQASQAE